MKKINKLVYVFSSLLALALATTIFLAKDNAAIGKKTIKKSNQITALAKKPVSSSQDSIEVPWSVWGHEISVDEAKTAAARAGTKIRIPRNPWGSEKPKIYVESFDVPPVPGRHAYAVIYPNGLEMIAHPEKPNRTLDFEERVRRSIIENPDHPEQLVTIHGQKAVAGERENSFYIDDYGKKKQLPSSVEIYEDGIRYTFAAPIGVPLAELIALVEETKDLTDSVRP